MRVRWFALGVLVGLALAPVDGRATWRLARDWLARAIDAVLRFGIDASSSPPCAYYIHTRAVALRRRAL
jgi:hypothetical protein